MIATLKVLGRDPTILIAGGTLYLYILAVAFVSGYVEYFGAQAGWFSPSVFQLLAYSSNWLIVASLITVTFVWLTCFGDPRTNAWKTVLIYHILFCGGTLFTCYSIRAKVLSTWPPYRLGPIVAVGPLIILAYLLLPLLMLLFRAAFYWRTKRSLIPSTELSGERNNVTWFTGVTLLIAGLSQMPSLCTYFGDTAASNYIYRQRLHFNFLNGDDGDSQSHILFTDGTRSITWDINALNRIMFHDTESGKSRVLMFVHDRNPTSQPTTTPTTQPSTANR